MGHLILVRHAQASFFGPSYDELSPLGREQARALGEHWAATGLAVDAVRIGPLRRHLQTCAIVAGVYRERGLHWPDAELLPELDEHAGLVVIKHYLGRADLGSDALHPGAAPVEDRERLMREFFRHFPTVMRDWASGALAIEGIESWAEFRARSLRALDALCGHPLSADTTERSAAPRVVAFTSGGVVSSAAGWLLGLDAERVIDLSFVLRNTALTEISWTAERRRLVSFNALPHLPDPRAVTSV
jgi:broad specificity phosphatase PhoE